VVDGWNKAGHDRLCTPPKHLIQKRLNTGIFAAASSDVSEFRSSEFLICVSGARLAVAQQIEYPLVGAVVSAYEALLVLSYVEAASALDWEWARNGRFIGRDDIERQALAVPVWQ
jgi:hypothetical protein